MEPISASTLASYPTLKDSGLFARRSTPGSELDMVNAYLAKMLTPPGRGEARLVFVEPRLETGFPDVVVVYLNADGARQWNPHRSKLGKPEICVLHHLSLNGSHSLDVLRCLFSST